MQPAELSAKPLTELLKFRRQGSGNIPSEVLHHRFTGILAGMKVVKDDEGKVPPYQKVEIVADVDRGYVTISHMQLKCIGFTKDEKHRGLFMEKLAFLPCYIHISGDRWKVDNGQLTFSSESGSVPLTVTIGRNDVTTDEVSRLVKHFCETYITASQLHRVYNSTLSTTSAKRRLLLACTLLWSRERGQVMAYTAVRPTAPDGTPRDAEWTVVPLHTQRPEIIKQLQSVPCAFLLAFAALLEEDPTTNHHEHRKLSLDIESSVRLFTTTKADPKNPNKKQFVIDLDSQHRTTVDVLQAPAAPHTRTDLNAVQITSETAALAVHGQSVLVDILHTTVLIVHEKIAKCKHSDRYYQAITVGWPTSMSETSTEDLIDKDLVVVTTEQTGHKKSAPVPKQSIIISIFASSEKAEFFKSVQVGDTVNFFAFHTSRSDDPNFDSKGRFHSIDNLSHFTILSSETNSRKRPATDAPDNFDIL